MDQLESLIIKCYDSAGTAQHMGYINTALEWTSSPDSLAVLFYLFSVNRLINTIVF